MKVNIPFVTWMVYGCIWDRNCQWELQPGSSQLGQEMIYLDIQVRVFTVLITGRQAHESIAPVCYCPIHPLAISQQLGNIYEKTKEHAAWKFQPFLRFMKKNTNLNLKGPLKKTQPVVKPVLPNQKKKGYEFNSRQFSRQLYQVGKIVPTYLRFS